MKKIGLILVILLSIFLFFGCTQTESTNNNLEEKKLTVVTTLYPLYEFAKEVGGENVSVSLLLPPGTETHSFEPKPTDIIKIEKANVFFYVGADMEPWAHDIIEGSSNKSITLIDSSKLVSLRETQKENEHEETMPNETTHEEEHEHEEEVAYEWAGVFYLENGTYTWSFSQVNGAYADPKMQFVIIPSEKTKNEALLEADTIARKILTQELADLNEGSTIFDLNAGYVLLFDESKQTSLFKLQIETSSTYVVFAQHLPTEFESNEHFLKNDKGNDIEALIEEPESAHHHHHGTFDPHLWLDFENDIKIIRELERVFSSKDPANASEYKARAENYITKLQALDKLYKTKLENCRTREFITGGHDAFGYLTQKYNLTSIAAFELSPDSEPTPLKLKKLIETINEHEVKYVAFETLVNPKTAEVLAEETGAKTFLLNPSHNLTKKEFDNKVTFLTLMENNLEGLVIALGCQ